MENLAVELLDKSKEKEVNSILKEKYYTLCKIRHSDIGGAEEDQVRLNRAYEQVETCMYFPYRRVVSKVALLT